MKVKDVNVEVVERTDNEMINKFFEAVKSKSGIEKTSSKDSTFFPGLFLIHGSLSEYIYLDENHKVEEFGLMNDGGKTFLGLAKCILDTNNYNEIIELASIGNENNVDTQIKDVFDSNINSPYGRLPPDLPIFSFGKCADHNKGKEDLNKEDMALSLISMYMQKIMFSAMSICMIKKISKVFLIGNIFKSEIFQKELKKRLSFFPSVVEIIILNCGYTKVLGAMVSG